MFDTKLFLLFYLKMLTSISDSEITLEARVLSHQKHFTLFFQVWILD